MTKVVCELGNQACSETSFHRTEWALEHVSLPSRPLDKQCPCHHSQYCTADSPRIPRECEAGLRCLRLPQGSRGPYASRLSLS